MTDDDSRPKDDEAARSHEENARQHDVVRRGHDWAIEEAAGFDATHQNVARRHTMAADRERNMAARDREAARLPTAPTRNTDVEHTP